MMAPQLVNGTVLAALGVLAFSLSFPGTVWSLDGFGPWTAVGLRGVIAAMAAGGALALTRAPVPKREDRAPLVIVALGCALGFPLLTTLALVTTSISHSAVVIGVLPMATAVIASIVTKRWQPPLFWLAAGLGAAVVVTFALVQNGGGLSVGDVYLFGAVVLCAAGYAEGGRLAARLPGWQVIAWGVVLAAPINIAVTVFGMAHEAIEPSAKALVGLAYIGLVSQFGGFVPWYRGMALVGVARASQVQLAQPLLTLVWAVLLLGERLTAATPVAALIVVACIVVTQRAKES